MTSPDSGSGRLTPTDHSLAHRVKDGDQEAAHVLYQRYACRVFGLVNSKLGAKLRITTDAEDVVQSVFRSIFRGVQAGNYAVEPGSTLWSLLAVISLTKLRRRAHHQTAQCRDVDRLVSLQTLSEGEAIDASRDEFLAMCVRETMQKLRPVDRQILLLRIEGFTVAEISEKTAYSCRTIERRLRTSRKYLTCLLLEDE